MLRKTLVVKQHGVVMPTLLLLTGVILLNARLLLRSILPRPDPNAMPANTRCRSSVWIRCCQAARPRDLWS
jgi:hypothetical protein